MLKQVLNFSRKHHLFTRGDRILIACSGGPDSLCLTHIFSRLAAACDLKLFIAHVEHGIRGQASVDDARFVENFCRQNGLPFYLKMADAYSYADRHRLSLETAARQLRYEFLRETARALDCSSIAVAHHRGDQAETILMHMLRGAGAAGLSGIRPKTRDIIRPLLSCTRSEIEKYCRRYNLSPRRDSTNNETAYTRNSVRLELLPFLRRYNPNIEETLSRTASLLAEENDFIKTHTRLIYSKMATKFSGRCILPLNEFSTQHIAVQRRLIREAVCSFCDDAKDFENIHADAVLSLARKAKTGSRLDLPHNIRAYIEYGRLIIASALPAAKIKLPPLLLSVPGTVQLDALNCRISAEIVLSCEHEKSKNTCYIDAAKLCGGLRIRLRENGDAFHPKGMKGRKKLKDLFIDNKIPREQRDKIPVLYDDSGIVWIAGIQQDNRCLPASAAAKLVKLTITDINPNN